jgi:hypothetical protein
MGGTDSTRWNDYERKLTVEECFSLDVNLLVKDRFIELGYRDAGQLVWKNQFGIELATCEIQADTTNIDDSWISITYATNKTGQVNQGIYLIPTTPNYGGIRWWFECPDCGKKAVKLYLAKEPHFACRTCCNLTYNTCRNSRSSFDFIKLLSMEISKSHGIPYKTAARLWREKTVKVGRRLDIPDYLGK